MSSVPFWGWQIYFRKFIHHFAQRTLPLTKLQRKESLGAYHWTPKCQAAFLDIKAALTSSPCTCLALPDYSKPFDIVTDACGHGLGAVLLQEGKPIAYESRQMTPAEENCEVT